jgi:hypothetical protein
MSNDKTTYQIRDIDKAVWRQFRARCIMAGFNSANECLNKLINMYVKDEISVKS